MKKLIKVLCAVLTLLAMSHSQAGGISDNGVNAYWGADAHGLGDLIGASTYDIQGADITRVGSVMRVAIGTNFARHADSGTAPAPGGIGYGDTFLARTWNLSTAKDKELEGTWTVTANQESEFTVDATKSALINFSSFALHWGETSQNDVIEGSVSMVPLPGSVPLLALGLCAMLYARRQRPQA